MGAQHFSSTAIFPHLITDPLLRALVKTTLGTDLHIWEWDSWSSGRMKPPVVIGHIERSPSDTTLQRAAAQGTRYVQTWPSPDVLLDRVTTAVEPHDPSVAAGASATLLVWHRVRFMAKLARRIRKEVRE